LLSVTDNGTGMSREVLTKVFDPFFTTKGMGRGTGLGLSMVYGFVRQSNGHIKLYSEVGHGTSVKIYLRRFEGDREADIVRVVEELPRGTERVLIAEDDEQVRASVVRQLRSLGYD